MHRGTGNRTLSIIEVTLKVLLELTASPQVITSLPHFSGGMIPWQPCFPAWPSALSTSSAPLALCKPTTPSASSRSTSWTRREDWWLSLGDLWKILPLLWTKATWFLKWKCLKLSKFNLITKLFSTSSDLHLPLVLDDHPHLPHCGQHNLPHHLHVRTLLDKGAWNSVEVGRVWFLGNRNSDS